MLEQCLIDQFDFAFSFDHLLDRLLDHLLNHLLDHFWFWFRRVALLFFKETLSFSNFAILLYNRSLLGTFLFLDNSPRLGNDIETIIGDGVNGSGIEEEVTTIESKVCFWNKRCFCSLVFTSSLRSFNSFL